jgi:hypothetical protein
MDPTPYFIMGALCGTVATLSIQWFANRKVRKALHVMQNAPVVLSEEVLLQQRETSEMRHRLAVLEKIVTDQPHRLSHEIDALR